MIFTQRSSLSLANPTLVEELTVRLGHFVCIYSSKIIKIITQLYVKKCIYKSFNIANILTLCYITRLNLFGYQQVSYGRIPSLENVSLQKMLLLYGLITTFKLSVIFNCLILMPPIFAGQTMFWSKLSFFGVGFRYLAKFVINFINRFLTT